MSANEPTGSDPSSEPTEEGVGRRCRLAQRLEKSEDSGLTYVCSFRREVVRLQRRLKVYVEEIGLETVFEQASLDHFECLLGSILSEFHAAVEGSYRALGHRNEFPTMSDRFDGKRLDDVGEDLNESLRDLWNKSCEALRSGGEDTCKSALDDAAKVIADTYADKLINCSENLKRIINGFVGSGPGLEPDACDGQCWTPPAPMEPSASEHRGDHSSGLGAKG